MTPAESLTLQESLHLYRQAYVSDASRARHDQPSCVAPAMSEEERQKQSAERRVEDADK